MWEIKAFTASPVSSRTFCRHATNLSNKFKYVSDTVPMESNLFVIRRCIRDSTVVAQLITL
jgi:hypothetical protein